jgi:hypothetical protein
VNKICSRVDRHFPWALCLKAEKPGHLEIPGDQIEIFLFLTDSMLDHMSLSEIQVRNVSHTSVHIENLSGRCRLTLHFTVSINIILPTPASRVR